MNGGSSLIFSNYYASMRSTVSKEGILSYWHHIILSVLSILESIQGKRIFKSAVCMHHLWCAYCRIFLICLCSAGDDKTEQNIFIKMNCSNLTRVNRPQTAVSQFEGCILSTFSHRNSSRTSQKPPPRQARLWLVERSPAGLLLVERSPVSGTYVHVTIMSGLELLTNSPIVNTICYEASDGWLDYIRTD